MNQVIYRPLRYEINRAEFGSEATYYSYGIFLGDQWWGVKSYPKAMERDRARRRQREAFEKGLGPPAGCDVEVHIPRKERASGFIKEYGYFTAQCRPFDENKSTSEHIIGNLKHRIKQSGLDIQDVRSDNIGWWNGGVVVLDFGDFSDPQRGDIE